MSFRKEALKRLGRTIRAHEKEIYEALRKDLNKSKTEAYMCEIGMTRGGVVLYAKAYRWLGKKKKCAEPYCTVFQ